MKGSGTIAVELTVNGRAVERDVPPTWTLRQLLHDELGLGEVKYGCGEGVCGACTVLLDGAPHATCILLAAQAHGREVVTAAGLEAHAPPAVRARLPLLVDHLVAREAFQCGYCAPGMVVSAADCLGRGGALGEADVRLALSGNICRCTGYQAIVDSVVAASLGEAPPAVASPREDIREKIAGAVTYPSDVRPAGQEPLVGRVLWSEHAHADLLGIDTSEALATPGVVAVLTHRDIPGKNLAGTTLFGADQPVLAADRVRCFGDAVALVAAENDEAAILALARIRVSYRPLPAVHDMLEALEETAPRIGEHGNTIAQFTKVKGDLDAGLRAADVIVEGTYASTINDHACMELEGGIAWMEGETVVLTVTSLTPHVVRQTVTVALGIPEAHVRVETPRMGGSFGKYLIPGSESRLALLVHATRRPVRLFLPRDEILVRSPKRHPFRGQYKLGLERDGTFVAFDADVLGDSGAYISLTPAVVSVFADEATGAYEIPNARVRARGVLTNNLPATPMRGFGSQQINFGMESLVEKAARALGLDSAEIRRKNFIHTRVDPTGNDVPEPTDAITETLDRVMEQLGDRPAAPPGWLVGRGIASIRAKYGFPYGLVDRFVARVSVDREGEITLESDIADSGTGMVAGLPRIVARTLSLARTPRYVLCREVAADPSGDWLVSGRPPTDFRRGLFRVLEWFQGVQATQATAITSRIPGSWLSTVLRLGARPVNALNSFIGWLKSALFPYGLDSYSPRTSGSRGMIMAGRAVAEAAERFAARAVELAAVRLALPAAQLVTGADGVSDRDDPSRLARWSELARDAGGHLRALGEAHLPSGDVLSPKNGNQLGSVDHVFATHACDLAVDPRTGLVQILRFVTSTDVGRALDPVTIRGQFTGAVTMGVGQALWEAMPIAGGKIQTAGLHEYLMATALDAPSGIVIDLVESGSGLGPQGCKGVGEACAVAAPAAVANAIYDALGVQLESITADPEAIQRLAASRRRPRSGLSDPPASRANGGRPGGRVDDGKERRKTP